MSMGSGSPVGLFAAQPESAITITVNRPPILMGCSPSTGSQIARRLAPPTCEHLLGEAILEHFGPNQVADVVSARLSRMEPVRGVTGNEDGSQIDPVAAR